MHFNGSLLRVVCFYNCSSKHHDQLSKIVCLFDSQFFQEAIVKSGRSPPDPHVPPYAYYELGVLYAQDSKVRFDWFLG